MTLEPETEDALFLINDFTAVDAPAGVVATADATAEGGDPGAALIAAVTELLERIEGLAFGNGLSLLSSLVSCMKGRGFGYTLLTVEGLALDPIATPPTAPGLFPGAAFIVVAPALLP